jgi:hypothetical protein
MMRPTRPAFFALFTAVALLVAGCSSGGGKHAIPTRASTTTVASFAKRGVPRPCHDLHYPIEKPTDLCTTFGQTITIAGLAVTASKLSAFSSGGTHSVLSVCADLTYRNTTAALKTFGPTNWSLSVEASRVITVVGTAPRGGSLGGFGLPQTSSHLAKRQTVRGGVCFPKNFGGEHGRYFLTWTPDALTTADRGIWIGSL